MIQLLETSHSPPITQLLGQQDNTVVTKEASPLRGVSSQDTPTSPSTGSHDTKSWCEIKHIYQPGSLQQANQSQKSL